MALREGQNPKIREAKLNPKTNKGTCKTRLEIRHRGFQNFEAWDDHLDSTSGSILSIRHTLTKNDKKGVLITQSKYAKLSNS